VAVWLGFHSLNRSRPRHFPVVFIRCEAFANVVPHRFRVIELHIEIFYSPKTRVAIDRGNRYEQ